MRWLPVTATVTLVSLTGAAAMNELDPGSGHDVVHAASEVDDPHALSWAPPVLSDPVTVLVDDDYITLDDSKDYVLRWPDTPVRHRVTIDGGRNVVAFGGEIDIPWQGPDAEIWQRRGLLLRDQTGTVHIEGLLITGEDLSEGINLDAPDAVVQLQNVRVEHVHARDQVNFSDNHPDVIQAWGGVGELRVDRLTAQSDYQGIFLKEDFGEIGPVALRRVHIEGDPTARYLYWDNDHHVVLIDRVFVSPAEGRPLQQSLWPDPSAWPGVQEGAPPGGEFVPRELVGIGYEAWPYEHGP